MCGVAERFWDRARRRKRAGGLKLGRPDKGSIY